MRKSPYNVLVKIIVCGNMMSGKTRICRTITGENTENNNYEPTIGLDLFSLSRNLEGNKNCKIHLLDTSGDKHYLSIIRSYFQSCAMVIIVVDNKKGQTIDHIREWIDESRESIQLTSSKHRFVPMAIFANTHKKKIYDPALMELCKNENVLLFEMDFGNDAEVQNAFDTIISFIDSQYLCHFLRHPGIKYAGMDDDDGQESMPLMGNRRLNTTHNGCCSIL